MPKVSFYILPSAKPEERHLFACRLIEKAYQNQQFPYVYTSNHQQSQQLDTQLWTFKADSFIPHQILVDQPPAFERSILIGAQDAPKKWQQLIVNLSLNCPEKTAQGERILEILDTNKAIKQAGRVRYKHYQQSGYDLTTHIM